MIIDPTTERSLEVPPRSAPTEIYGSESIGLNTKFSRRNLGSLLAMILLCQSAGFFYMIMTYERYPQGSQSPLRRRHRKEDVAF
jgi:hypothetical protein